MSDSTDDERELPLPLGWREESDSFELVRLWMIDGRLHRTLANMHWTDGARMWGVVLADLTRHVAKYLTEEFTMDPEEALQMLQHEITHQLSLEDPDTEGGIGWTPPN